MFTLVAYSSAAAGINAVLTGLPAVSDPHVRVNVNDVIIPVGLNKIIGALPVGATITRAQLQSPSLRRFINQELAPLDAAAIPSSPSLYIPYVFDPLTLDEQEALNAFITNTASDRETVLVWLADGPPSPIDADFRTCRFTATTTLAVGGWTNCILTADQVLPAGRYSVIGMRARSAGLIAARLVFTGYQWRPGVPGVQAATHNQYAYWRQGNIGEYGRFDHNTPPTIDCLSNTADTSETFELDLVKVA